VPKEVEARVVQHRPDERPVSAEHHPSGYAAGQEALRVLGDGPDQLICLVAAPACESLLRPPTRGRARLDVARAHLRGGQET
jgi:hypothetical protein